MTKISIISALVALLTSITSCQRGKSAQPNIIGDTITSQARLLTIIDCQSHVIVEVQNPWQEDALLQRYALVHRDSSIPENLPTEATLVRVPLTSALVYSSVHAGAFVELGCANAITGIVDAEFYKLPQIVDGVKTGKVIDAGNSMSPSIEKIVELSPQAILTSPFQNAGHGAIDKLGIPIIECADYMEATPLGRAEWIKLLGELLCKRKEAATIYDNVAQSYNSLVALIKGVKERPMVISEMMTDGVWFLPGGKSYMAQIYADAGAYYPWNDNNSTGSLQLDFATVYDKAYNARYWIIKSFEPNFSLADLKAKYPLNEKLEAFKNGGVYVINTVETSFFEDFPFHPDLLLREYITLFHPQLIQGDNSFRYLRQLK